MLRNRSILGCSALAVMLFGAAGTSHGGDNDASKTVSEYVLVALPARIEAENYERFFETTPATNAGGQCDRADGVDKGLAQDPNGGNCNIGWTAAGEWL